MIAYILDKTNLKIKDFFFFGEYLFCDDIEYADKSRIVAPRMVNVQDDDFVVCKNDTNAVIFFGIAYDTNANEKTTSFALTLKPKEALFDRFIFASGESTIATSIEQFIANTITSNWISSGDALMDRAYLRPVVQTNTPIAASLSNIANVEDGVYNLKTFLGNVKERYGIFLDFVLGDTDPSIQTGPILTINIYQDTADVVPIDTDVSDISDTEEIYNVDVLAKLNVKWLNTTTEATTYRTFYLKADRTTTEDVNDPDRVDGTIKSVYIEAETEPAMLDEVTNEFRSNKYEHRITFMLREGSELYKADDYYVGRQCRVETQQGVRTSLITAIERETGSGVRKVTLGKLKVTLTNKLRGKV